MTIPNSPAFGSIVAPKHSAPEFVNLTPPAP
jgi:hypothetical protein